MLLPPIPGTQPGTVQDSRPMVLFHAAAMRLNADRNGAEMTRATTENALPIQPGIFLMKSQVLLAAFLIHFQEAGPGPLEPVGLCGDQHDDGDQSTMTDDDETDRGLANKAAFNSHWIPAHTLVAAPTMNVQA
jgi:hypothetical protein